MFKLWATILKDIRILIRDKVGLTLMFVMPIFLVLIITSIQNSTFELVNERKMVLLICNKDTGSVSKQFIAAIKQIGMFDIAMVSSDIDTIRAKFSDARTGSIRLPLLYHQIFQNLFYSKSKAITDKAINIADSVKTESFHPGQRHFFFYTILFYSNHSDKPLKGH